MAISWTSFKKHKYFQSYIFLHSQDIDTNTGAEDLTHKFSQFTLSGVKGGVK